MNTNDDTRPAGRAALLLLALALPLTACGPRAADEHAAEGAPMGGPVRLAEGVDPAALAARVDRFAPVRLEFDASLLDDRQKRLVARLVEASDVLDGIFLEQVWRSNPALADRLETAEGTGMDAARTYFRIMYGPWDRLAHDGPFLDVGPKPPGAGYYPEDATKEELEAWLEAHPDQREAFSSYYTVVRREGDGFRLVPYSEQYGDRLRRAADLLREAADLADNPSLARFLEARADAFLSNDYFESEVAWMNLEDNLVDPTIGPYEVYEDALFGYKAAFESFITLRDPAESARLERLVARLPDLERALPIADEHKYLDRPFTSPISVVTEIYAAGDTRAGVQTLAFNLPNDPRVRERGGSKKVMLANVIEAKFDKILQPIGRTLMESGQAAEIAFEPFYTGVLVHELAHGLGPDYVTGREDLTVSQALQERYSAIEEAKADVVGLHSLAVLTERGEYDEAFLRAAYLSHVASLFRCVRFGVTEAHGKGCLMQFNWLVEKGVLLHDEASGAFRVDLGAMPAAVSGLAREFLTLQATGDYEGAGAFMQRHGDVPEVLTDAIARLHDVPVDIRPEYAVKEMMSGW